MENVPLLCYTLITLGLYCYHGLGQNMNRKKEKLEKENQIGKRARIMNAMQELLTNDSSQNIAVSDIAKKAGIGKGSIYYYYPSKDAIVDALIRRSYEQPLLTAKSLSSRTDISSFTRMAMLFQACRNSSVVFIRQKHRSETSAQDLALLHQKYLNYLVSELKPVLTEIISQGIACGEIHFDYPAALSEIALIVLAVKLDNSLVPSAPEEIEDTLKGLISLLEEGTGVPAGTLDYLSLIH